MINQPFELSQRAFFRLWHRLARDGAGRKTGLVLEEPGHLAAIPDRAQVVFANPYPEARSTQTKEVAPCNLRHTREEEGLEVGPCKVKRDPVSRQPHRTKLSSDLQAYLRQPKIWDGFAIR